MPAPLDLQTCFQEFAPSVLRWARALQRCDADAQDLRQDVFLRLARRRPHFQTRGEAIVWLRRTTVNAAIDSTRRRQIRRETIVEKVPESGVHLVDGPEIAETQQRVRAALDRLSERQRMVLLAKQCDQLTFDAIAAELGISSSAAKTHYVRALMALRAELKDLIEETQR